MIDERDLFERAAQRFDPPVDALERLFVQRDHRQRNRRVRTAVVAVALAVIAGFALARAFGNVQNEVPAVRPPFGTIVFSRQLAGSQVDHLFAIGPDGVLSRFRTGFDVFSISPDGAHVLYPDDDFQRTPEILPAIVDLDGSDRRLIRPTVPMFPNGWSADGTRIVGVGAAGLYTASATDGGGQIEVTAPQGRRNDEAIGYSPDGLKILFLRSAKDVGGNNGRATKDLFVVNADGNGAIQLNPLGTVLGPFDAGVAGTPVSPVWDLRTASWSPDGSRVAFAAAAATPGEARNGEVRRGLFVVDADGGDPHQIVPSAQILDAQWSPDGEWIAFTQADPDRPDIFIVHPDGSGLRVLTSSSEGLGSWGPVWSPDGSALLFNRNGGLDQFDSELWFVNVDGFDLTQLTRLPAEYFSYGWSLQPH